MKPNLTPLIITIAIFIVTSIFGWMAVWHDCFIILAISTIISFILSIILSFYAIYLLIFIIKERETK